VWHFITIVYLAPTLKGFFLLRHWIFFWTTEHGGHEHSMIELAVVLETTTDLTAQSVNLVMREMIVKLNRRSEFEETLPQCLPKNSRYLLSQSC